MATQYAFVTRWQFKAPLPDVWDAIYSSLEWPAWWKGVLAVTELEKGDEGGIGSVRAYSWRSVLPYQLSFRMRLVEIETHKRMKGQAFGELEGEGEWFFTEKEGITHVEYHWMVFTNKAWMNYLSFMLKPAFQYNHDVVMRWGAQGLASKLNAELISYS